MPLQSLCSYLQLLTMPTPSLILVPARFKTGKLYTPLATTSGGVVLGASGDFNVTRATTATRVNANGLIESVASGIPRLDYPIGGGCPALLVEPSAQNLALRSEEFNVSGTWTPVIGGTGSSPSVTANAVVSPDGTQNAETVLLNRGAGNTLTDQSTLAQNITLATSGTYTFSVYAKATASGDVGKQIFLRAGGVGSLIAYTLTANWVRLTRTETGLASGSNTFQIGNRGTITANNSVSVDLWGAQVETGSVATSYIPTTAASVTRNADVINVSGAVSGCIGQTEGVLYIECESNNGLDDVIFINQLVSDSIVLTKNGSNSYIGQIYHSSNIITFTSASNVTGMVKIAIAYKSGNSTMYLNGSRVGTLNTTAITFGGALSRIGISKSAFFLGARPSRIRAIATYTTRLTDTELAALTTL
jgi:hypothetical protein